MVRMRSATPHINLRAAFLDHQQQMAAHLAAGLKHLTHPTTKGDAQESAWLKLFEQYLPQRYRVMKAFVVDCRGAVSEQIDIVIFDRQYSPLMLVHEGAQYVPAESVYGVFEVRPSLTPGTLRYAGQKLRSVRSLERTSARVPDVSGVLLRKKLYPILGGILTLNSGIRTEAALRQAVRGRNIGLDLGCSLNGRSFVIEPAAGRRRGRQILVSDQSESLIFFFLKLLEYLQRLGTAPAVEMPAYGASLRSL